jgi:hypothetical protein
MKEHKIKGFYMYFVDISHSLTEIQLIFLNLILLGVVVLYYRARAASSSSSSSPLTYSLMCLDVARPKATPCAFVGRQVDEAAGVTHRLLDANGERHRLGSMVVHEV